DLVERDSGKQLFHVGERSDRDPYLAHLAFRLRVVGVDPELGRKIESQGETRLSLAEQVLEALVRLPRRAESGVLPHRPELPQVHVAVDTAGERILARWRRDFFDVVRAVERLDGDPAPGDAHGRNSFLRIASSRVISRTTSPFWFFPRKRNFTTPACPGFPMEERRGSSSLFDSTVLSANRVSPENTGVRWRPSS